MDDLAVPVSGASACASVGQPDADFIPPDIGSVALMILAYAQIHGMAPIDLLDVFYRGIESVEREAYKPQWLVAAGDSAAPSVDGFWTKKYVIETHFGDVVSEIWRDGRSAGHEEAESDW